MNLKRGALHLAPGGAGTVELDVVNRGERPSPGSVITAKKTLLGAAEVESLATQSQRVVAAITAPATAAGYAVGIEIDDQRRVSGDDPDQQYERARAAHREVTSALLTKNA